MPDTVNSQMLAAALVVVVIVCCYLQEVSLIRNVDTCISFQDPEGASPGKF